MRERYWSVAAALALVGPVALTGACSDRAGAPIDAGPVTTSSFVLPYVVQGIIYSPPFNKSSVSYAGLSTLGTRTRMTLTTDHGLTFPVSALPTPPQSGTSIRISTLADTTVVTDVRTLGVSVDNAPECDPSDSACNPQTNDPVHGADSYVMAFGVMGSTSTTADGQRSTTVDFSTGSFELFNVAELEALAQDPQDLSDFVDLTKVDIIHKFITPADAQQLLAMDPYALGQSIDQSPQRFEPGCNAPGSCASPDHLSVGRRQFANEPDVIVEATTAHADPATSDTTSSTGVMETVRLLPDAGGASLGTLTVSYGDVTANADFSTRTASVVLDNSSQCELGTVDLWFDKVFGSFLWITHLSSGCQP